LQQNQPTEGKEMSAENLVLLIYVAGALLLLPATYLLPIAGLSGNKW